MATKVVMEALSPTMEEGRLVSWKKKEGDAVKSGELLAEVETDKAVMDLVARADGVLRKQLVAEGTTVPVSATVGIIAGKDEDISGLVGEQKPAAQKPAAPAATQAPQANAPSAGPSAGGPAPAPPAQAGARQEARAEGAGEQRPSGRAVAEPALERGETQTSAGRVKSSPLARRIAAERGVDLHALRGSGPEGRVVARDVEKAPAGGAAPRPAAAAPSGVPPVSEGFRDVPLTQMRKTIAKRLVQSIGPIPTFYLTSEIDMERAFEARGQLKAMGDEYAFSFNDLVIKAVALALRKHQAVNSWWMEDHIRYHGDVHVGMAVAIEDGLITPVIRYADKKGLTAISAEAKALADKARARRLAPEEYTGATFSVSNLGMLDIDEFTAVINPPETGILAIGRIVEKPVVMDGVITSRRMMRVTMSCDHRVVDGATGARFLQSVKLMLENPLAMLL